MNECKEQEEQEEEQKEEEEEIEKRKETTHVITQTNSSERRHCKVDALRDLPIFRPGESKRSETTPKKSKNEHNSNS